MFSESEKCKWSTVSRHVEGAAILPLSFFFLWQIRLLSLLCGQMTCPHPDLLLRKLCSRKPHLKSRNRLYEEWHHVQIRTTGLIKPHKETDHTMKNVSLSGPRDEWRHAEQTTWRSKSHQEANYTTNHALPQCSTLLFSVKQVDQHTTIHLSPEFKLSIVKEYQL